MPNLKTPTDLEDFLVCPITRNQLKLVQEVDKSALEEPGSGNRYEIIDNVGCMIPATVPSFLSDKIELWQKLQFNGATSYELAPELNLTQDPEYSRKYIESIGLSGLVLDVGCGPQQTAPVYARNIAADNYVGLDPLPGIQPRQFNFVQGIGELLPFRDETFDHVLFTSSLDHMLDYHRSVDEALRVVRPGGQVSILMDIVEESGEQRSRLQQWLHIFGRGIGQLFSAWKSMGFVPAVQYVMRIAKLKIPEGAMDYFHSSFPTVDDVVAGLDGSVGYHIQQKPVGDEVALIIRKP